MIEIVRNLNPTYSNKATMLFEATIWSQKCDVYFSWGELKVLNLSSHNGNQLENVMLYMVGYSLYTWLVMNVLNL